MLCLPQQDIPANRTFEPRFKPTLVIEQNDAYSVIRTAMQQGWGEHDVSEANQHSDMMQGNLQLFFVIDFDDDRVMIQVCVGARCHQVQSVFKLLHLA